MTPLDTRAYRKTIGQFATGVTVLAAEVGGTIHGMTANAVTSLSLEPLLVLVCVGKTARMAGALRAANGFSINILRDDQEALSAYFAGGWKEPDPPPYHFIPWTGGPRLEGSLAALGCTLHEWIEGGDHWIIVGRVIALHQGAEPRRPLLFYSGSYHRLGPPEPPPTPTPSPVDPTLEVYCEPEPDSGS